VSGEVETTSSFQVGSPPPSPPPLEDESIITRGWDDGPVLVSVLCPTYQQVDFISQALQGFLGQRTTFRFEVIVRDDASTDGTSDVVADFAQRFPGIIRCILEKENRYPSVDPLTPLIAASTGQFIAFCEGDDYWVDPDKLQKQAMLLVQSGAAASHHGQVEVQDGLIVAPTDLSGRNLRDRDGVELRTSMKSLLTRTIMVRKAVLVEGDGLTYLRSMWAGDSMVTAMIGAAGGSVYADAHPAIYRVHDSGISTLLKRDPVIWSANKAMDARLIGKYLLGRGFTQEAGRYFSLAQDRATQSIIGLLATVLALLTGRGRIDPSGWAIRWRTVRKILRLSSSGAVTRSLLEILRRRFMRRGFQADV